MIPILTIHLYPNKKEKLLNILQNAMQDVIKWHHHRLWGCQKAVITFRRNSIKETKGESDLGKTGEVGLSP